VAVLSAVVLLRSVLENDNLLRVVVLQNRRLDARALHVRLAPVRSATVVSSENALERNLRARLDTLQTVALVVSAFGHELLRATNLDDGVPLRRRAGGRRRVEAHLVDGALRRGCAYETKFTARQSPRVVRNDRSSLSSSIQIQKSDSRTEPVRLQTE